MYPIIFRHERFRYDVSEWCKENSIRKLSAATNHRISPSTIHRITSGKKKDICAFDLCAICGVIGCHPTDYFSRVLF